MKSTFNQDLNKEQLVVNFLENNFYNNSFVFTNYVRCEDIINQKKGVDCIFTSPLLSITNGIIDEKAQVSRALSTPYNTFSFEISYVHNEERKTGWLLNQNLKTHYYSLIWLRAKNDFTTSEDIIWLDYLLLNKHKIQKYISSVNFNGRSFDEAYSYMLTTNEDKPMKLKTPTAWFYKSNKLAEKPINVIIQKDKLIELSCFRHTIKK